MTDFRGNIIGTIFGLCALSMGTGQATATEQDPSATPAPGSAGGSAKTKKDSSKIKAKSKTTKATDKKSTGTPDDATTNDESNADVDSKTAHSPGSSSYLYPYHDSILTGDETPRYALSLAQQVKTGAMFALGYATLNSKYEGGKVDHSLMYFGAEASIPIAKKFVFSINPNLLTDNWKSSLTYSSSSSTSSATTDVTSTTTAKSQQIGATIRAAFIATPLIDIGAGTRFTSLSEKRTNKSDSASSSTTSDGTRKYSNNALEIQAGAHTAKFEASLQFLPGSKYTESSTSTSGGYDNSSDTDSYLSQEINLLGRYQILPSGLFATGYAQTSSDPDTKGNRFAVGGGTASSSFQCDASMIIASSTTSANQSSGTSDSKSNQTIFEFNVATIDNKAPRFGINFDYMTDTYKSSDTTITTSFIALTGLAAIRF